MFIRKGTSVWFKLEDGKRVSAPRGAALLHDPSGKQWNKCSALVAPFRTNVRPATEAEMKGAPSEYLGRSYRASVGTLEVPPRRLSEWERIGVVKEIRYTRGGTKAPGKFFHPFNKRVLMFAFTAGDRAVLYRRGNAMRLEMGSGCIWDDRGIVRP